MCVYIERECVYIHIYVYMYKVHVYTHIHVERGCKYRQTINIEKIHELITNTKNILTNNKEDWKGQ